MICSEKYLMIEHMSSDIHTGYALQPYLLGAMRCSHLGVSLDSFVLFTHTQGSATRRLTNPSQAGMHNKDDPTS